MEPKISIRPTINSIDPSAETSAEEGFQNHVLRPVLKLQHDLLIAFFHQYTVQNKIDYAGLSALQQQELISKVFKNDNQFKLAARGLIVGLFTLEEYQQYVPMSSALNRRITTMMEQRLLSSVAG